MLPQGTPLGRLMLLEVFDYYDGPKLFAAHNAVGTIFFVFWTDQDSATDTWFYVPISKGRLESVKSGEFTLRDAILHPEDGSIFEVVVPAQKGNAVVTQTTPEKISPARLPPVGDVLDPDDQRGFQEEAIPSIPTGSYELAIGRSKRKTPKIAHVVEILSGWSALLESTLETIGFKTNFVPVATRIGSFIVTLAGLEGADTAQAIDILRRVVPLPTAPEDVSTAELRSSRVDLEHLAHLLAAVEKSKSDLQISIPRASGGSEVVMKIDANEARGLLGRVVVALSGVIASEHVPQADRIKTVFRAVEILSRGEEVTPEALEVVPRQVNYYKHAARVLDLLDKDYLLTPAGQRLVLCDPQEQMRIAANQFEKSRCGWLWIRWCNKTSISDVDPETAEEFLLAASVGINDTTKKRRAQTLRAWASKFIAVVE